ncbi:MAG: tetratricopeptide repeat protein, partial [Myxococcota bacterium]|nr:tetratricopeptide repeat protein [Myxococcota bacterium]
MGEHRWQPLLALVSRSKTPPARTPGHGIWGIPTRATRAVARDGIDPPSLRSRRGTALTEKRAALTETNAVVNGRGESLQQLLGTRGRDARRASTRARAIVAALALAIAMPSIVLPPTMAHADVRTEARTMFRRGMAMVAEGNLDEGVAQLQEAYDMLPHPNVLYNIARAYAEAGRYEQAIEYFQRYLESDPADRDEVQSFLNALRQRIDVQQQRATAAAAPVAPTPAEPTAVDQAPLATAEEIQALEDSATQIAALAEATQIDALRQRADR